MSGEYWSNEDKLRLKKLHIDPVRSPPERLKEMVNYFRKPGASVFAITEGDGPLQVSKSLARKVRDYQAEGALDWVMGQKPGRSDQQFNSEWREWLLSNSAEFAQAVEAYGQELSRQIRSAEIHLGLRATFTPSRVRYGPKHQPFIESIFSRDPDLADVKKALESAISQGDIDTAKMLSKKVGEGLASRISI